MSLDILYPRHLDRGVRRIDLGSGVACGDGSALTLPGVAGVLETGTFGAVWEQERGVERSSLQLQL